MSQVVDIDNGYYNIVNLLDGLSRGGVGVDVGIFDDPYVAMYATFNEVGTATIPARPFMREAVDGHESENVAILGDAIGKAIDAAKEKRPYATELIAALNVLGIKIQHDVQNSILVNNFQRNAPPTIQKKGFDWPLVETGSMHDAIGYRVVAPYWSVVGTVEGRAR